MCTNSSNKFNGSYKKVLARLVQCFVFIFAFMFVGVIGGNDSVDAANTVYDSDMNTSYFKSSDYKTFTLIKNFSSGNVQLGTFEFDEYDWVDILGVSISPSTGTAGSKSDRISYDNVWFHIFISSTHDKVTFGDLYDKNDYYVYIPLSYIKGTSFSFTVKITWWSGTLNRGTFYIKDGSSPDISGFKLDSGASYTKSKSVAVGFTAKDNDSSLQYCVTEASTSDKCSWSSTKPTTYKLDGDVNGERTVYLYTKDSAGNIGSASDTIIFDQVAPDVTFSIASPVATYKTFLTWNINDTTPISKVEVTEIFNGESLPVVNISSFSGCSNGKRTCNSLAYNFSSKLKEKIGSLEQVEITLKVTFYDAVNNKSSAQQSFTYDASGIDVEVNSLSLPKEYFIKLEDDVTTKVVVTVIHERDIKDSIRCGNIPRKSITLDPKKINKGYSCTYEFSKRLFSDGDKYTITITGVESGSGVTQAIEFDVIIDMSAPKINLTANDKDYTSRKCVEQSDYCINPVLNVKMVEANVKDSYLSFALFKGNDSFGEIDIKSLSTTSSTKILNSINYAGFTLKDTIYLKVLNFQDKAGNYFCNQGNGAWCEVARIYVSTVAPKVGIKYGNTIYNQASETIYINGSEFNKFAITGDDIYLDANGNDIKSYTLEMYRADFANDFSSFTFAGKTCSKFYCKYNNMGTEYTIPGNVSDYKYLLRLTIYGSSGDTTNSVTFNVVLDVLAPQAMPTSITLGSESVEEIDGNKVIRLGKQVHEFFALSDLNTSGNKCTSSNQGDKTCSVIIEDLEKYAGGAFTLEYSYEYEGKTEKLGENQEYLPIVTSKDTALTVKIFAMDRAGNVGELTVNFDNSSPKISVELKNENNTTNLVNYDGAYYFVNSSIDGTKYGAILTATIKNDSGKNIKLDSYVVCYYSGAQCFEIKNDDTDATIAVDATFNRSNIEIAYSGNENISYKLVLNFKDDYGNSESIEFAIQGYKSTNKISSDLRNYLNNYSEITIKTSTSLTYRNYEVSQTGEHINHKRTNWVIANDSVLIYLPAYLFENKTFTFTLVTNYNYYNTTIYHTMSSQSVILENDLNEFKVTFDTEKNPAISVVYEKIEFMVRVILIDNTDSFDLSLSAIHVKEDSKTMDLANFGLQYSACADTNSSIYAYCGTNTKLLTLTPKLVANKDSDSSRILITTNQSDKKVTITKQLPRFKDTTYNVKMILDLATVLASLYYEGGLTPTSTDVTIYDDIFIYESEISLTPIYYNLEDINRNVNRELGHYYSKQVNFDKKENKYYIAFKVNNENITLSSATSVVTMKQDETYLGTKIEGTKVIIVYVSDLIFASDGYAEQNRDGEIFSYDLGEITITDDNGNAYTATIPQGYLYIDNDAPTITQIQVPSAYAYAHGSDIAFTIKIKEPGIVDFDDAVVEDRECKIDGSLFVNNCLALQTTGDKNSDFIRLNPGQENVSPRKVMVTRSGEYLIIEAVFTPNSKFPSTITSLAIGDIKFNGKLVDFAYNLMVLGDEAKTSSNYEVLESNYRDTDVATIQLTKSISVVPSIEISNIKGFTKTFDENGSRYVNSDNKLIVVFDTSDTSSLDKTKITSTAQTVATLKLGGASFTITNPQFESNASGMTLSFNFPEFSSISSLLANTLYESVEGGGYRLLQFSTIELQITNLYYKNALIGTINISSGGTTYNVVYGSSQESFEYDYEMISLNNNTTKLYKIVSNHKGGVDVDSSSLVFNYANGDTKPLDAICTAAKMTYKNNIITITLKECGTDKTLIKGYVSITIVDNYGNSVDLDIFTLIIDNQTPSVSNIKIYSSKERNEEYSSSGAIGKNYTELQYMYYVLSQENQQYVYYKMVSDENMASNMCDLLSISHNVLDKNGFYCNLGKTYNISDDLTAIESEFLTTNKSISGDKFTIDGVEYTLVKDATGSVVSLEYIEDGLKMLLPVNIRGEFALETNILYFSYRLNNYYDSTGEINLNFHIYDNALNESNIITISNIRAVQKSDISLAPTYSVYDSSCTTTSNVYRCVLGSSAVLRYRVKVDVKYVDFIEDLTIDNFNIGENIFATRIVEAPSGVYLVEFDFSKMALSLMESVSHMDTYLSIENISDIAGNELEEKLKLERNEEHVLYLYGNMDNLSIEEGSTRDIDCLVNATDCDPQSIITRAIDNNLINELTNYGYTLTLSEYSLSDVAEGGVNVTVTVERFDKATKVFENFINIVVGKRQITVVIDETKLSSPYGSQPLFYFEHFYGNLRDDFTITELRGLLEAIFKDGEGNVVGNIQYANVGEYTYDLVAKDPSRYDITIVRTHDKYSVVPATITITPQDLVRDYFYLDDDYTKQVTESSIVKEYKVNDVSSDQYIYANKPNYFGDISLEFYFSVKYTTHNVGERIAMLSNVFYSSSPNYVVAYSQQFTLGQYGAIYAATIDPIDMSSAISKYDDNTTNVYYTGYAQDINYVFTTRGYQIRIPSDTNLLEYGDVYNGDVRYVLAKDAPVYRVQTGSGTDTTVCYKVSDDATTCLLNGKRYKVPTDGSDEFRLSLFTSIDENFIVGDVLGTIIPDTIAPTFNVTHNAFAYTNGVYYGSPSVTVGYDNLKENNVQNIHVSTSTVGLYEIYEYEYDNGMITINPLSRPGSSSQTFVCNSENICSEKMFILNGYRYVSFEGNDNNTYLARVDELVPSPWTVANSVKYAMIATDAVGNYTAKILNFNVDADGTMPEIEDVLLDTNMQSAPVYGVGSRYNIIIKLTVAASFAYEDFDITANGVSIMNKDAHQCYSNPNDPTQVICNGVFANEHNLIGSYNNKDNNIKIVIGKIHMQSYFGVENNVGNPNALSWNLKANNENQFNQVKITIDFSVVRIVEANVEFKNCVDVDHCDTNYTNPINKDDENKKVYSTFNYVKISFVFAGEITDINSLNLNMKGVEVGKTVKTDFAYIDMSSCSLTGTTYTCVIKSFVGLNQAKLYHLLFEGTIQYASNSQNVEKDISVLTSEIPSLQELYYDNTPLNVSISLVDEDRRDHGVARFEITCSKENVDCVIEDDAAHTFASKILLDNTPISNNTNYELNGNIITVKNLSSGVHTLKLDQGAIIDYAGHLSEESNVIRFDNTLPSISSITFTSISEGIPHKEGQFTVIITLNRELRFTSGVNIIYKFGNGNEKQSELITLSGSVSQITGKIKIVEGDTGNLSIISIVTDTISIKDESRYVTNVIGNSHMNGDPLSLNGTLVNQMMIDGVEVEAIYGVTSSIGSELFNVYCNDNKTICYSIDENNVLRKGTYRDIGAGQGQFTPGEEAVNAVSTMDGKRYVYTDGSYSRIQGYTIETNIIADTTAPVLEKTEIRYDGDLIDLNQDEYKWKLNPTTIGKVTVTFTFDSNLSLNSVITITNNLGANFKSGQADVLGNTISITLDSESFSKNGELLLGYTLNVLDLYDNLLQDNLPQFNSNIIYDSVAPEIVMESDTYYVNIMSGTYDIEYSIDDANASYVGGEILVNGEGITISKANNENVLNVVLSNIGSYVITIPAGFYMDEAQNPSPKKEFVLEVGSDAYNLKPLYDVRGTKYDAILVNGTYYVNSLDKLYFEVEGSYTTIRALDTAKLQILNKSILIYNNTPDFEYTIEGNVIKYIDGNDIEIVDNKFTINGIVYTLDLVNEVVKYELNNTTQEIAIVDNVFKTYAPFTKIAANMFSVDSINNSDSIEYRYVLAQDLKLESEVEITDNNNVDSEYLAIGDKITLTLKLSNPRNISTGVPNLNIAIGNNYRTMTIVDSSSLFEVVYEYTIKNGDSGEIELVNFDSSIGTLDVVNNKLSTIRIAKELGYIAETASFKPMLSLVENNRSATSATFSVSCGNKENVDCTILEANYNKILVNGSQVDSNRVAINGNLITINGLEKDQTYIISLAAGAIVDRAGNLSLASNEVDLDNTLISITGVSGNDIESGEGYITVSVIFNKAVTFKNGIAKVVYKFGNGENKTPVTINNVGANMTSLIVNLPVASGDNGELTIVSVNSDYGIVDASYYATYSVEYGIACENIIANTTEPQLLSSSIDYSSDNTVYGNEDKYYLNSINIAKVKLTFVFDRELRNDSSITIVTTLGTLKSEKSNVLGNTIVVNLSGSNFSDGELEIRNISLNNVVDKLGNSYKGHNIEADVTTNKDGDVIVNSDTKIVYDNTAPVISHAQYVGTGKGNPETVFTYTLTVNEINKVSETYTITRTYSIGRHALTIEQGYVVDKAGNKSDAKAFSYVEVEVSNEKPELDIYGVTFSNENIVYYGNVDNRITLNYGLTCILTSTGDCKDGLNKVLISKDVDNRLVINAGIYTNEYGNPNDAVVTDYIFVDNSMEFETEINKDKSFAVYTDNDNEVVISVNVTPEEDYYIVFTSNRDLNMDKSNGRLTSFIDEVDGNRYYKYTFDNEIVKRKTTINVYDFFNNAHGVFTIIIDNVGPAIVFEQAVYTFNSQQAASGEGIDLYYTVDDVTATATPGIGISVTGAVVQVYDEEFRINITGATTVGATYELVIPAGFYTDGIGNESSAMTIKITIKDGPYLTPLVEKDGKLVAATLSGTTYYLKDLSSIKFEVKLPGNVQINSKTDNVVWDDLNDKYIYTYDNSAKHTDVTIAAGAITVNTVDNQTQTFTFAELTQAIEMTNDLPDVKDYINENDTITITYTIVDSRNLRLSTGVPNLKIKIGAVEYSLEGRVDANKIIYTYLPLDSHNGDVIIVGLDLDSQYVIYDYAYNNLNVVINEKIKNVVTNYVVDTSNLLVPTMEVSSTGCIKSIQNGSDAYYYCDSSDDSNDEITIKVTFDSENIPTTSTLTLKVNGVALDGFKANESGEYVLRVADLAASSVTPIVISLVGEIKDEVGNATSVDLTQEQYNAIDGGYKLNLKVDAGYSVVSHTTALPTFTLTNNIGVYDDILAGLVGERNSNYVLMCGEQTCSSLSGNALAGLYLDAQEYVNNDVKIFVKGQINGDISFVANARLVLGEDNIVTVNSKAINVEQTDTGFTIDTVVPEIVNSSVESYKNNIENSLKYNDRYYLVPDASVQIKVKFNREVSGTDFIVKISNGEYTIQAEKAVIYEYVNSEDYDYVIELTRSDMNNMYSKFMTNNQLVELVITLGNIKGDNNVITNNVALATKLYIDKVAPSVEFGSIVDNSTHTITTDDINAIDNESGIKTITYYVDNEVYEVVDNKINLGAYSHGEHTIKVVVMDNTGNDITKEYKLFIDKNPPVLTLESLRYNTSAVDAVITIEDDSNIPSSVNYCVVTSDVDQCASTLVANVESGKVNIHFDFTTNIKYTNFRIIINSIKDNFENTTELFKVDALKIDEIEDKDVFLTSYTNCVASLTKTCNYNYVIDFDKNNYGYEVYNIANVKSGLNVIRSATSKVTLSSDVNMIGANFEVTLQKGIVYATFDVELNNFVVNIDKAITEQVNVSLIQGTTIDVDSLAVNNENVALVTTDKVECASNEACDIEFVVTDRSGWSYKVDKHLDVAEVASTQIQGISSDTFIDRNGNANYVVYRTGDTISSISFLVASTKVIEPSNINDELVLGLNSYTYGYYDDAKVLTTVTYNVYVVDMRLADLAIDTTYKNVHELDISSIFNKDYDAVYEVSMDGYTTRLSISKDNVVTLPQEASNVIKYSDYKLILNSNKELNGIYDLTIVSYIKDALIKSTKTLEDIKFDNGSSIIEIEVSTIDSGNDTWDNSKMITVTFTCTREFADTCIYHIIGPNGERELVESSVVETETIFNGTFTLTIEDDAGNIYVKEFVVANIDLVAPGSDEVYAPVEDIILNNCQVTDGLVIYCNDPNVTVLVKDDEGGSGIKSYKFGYSVDGGEIIYDGTATELNSKVFRLNDPEKEYAIYVIVEDLAGNSHQIELATNIRYANVGVTIGSVVSEKVINKLMIPTIESKDASGNYIEIIEKQVCLKNDDGETCYDITEESIVVENEISYIDFTKLLTSDFNGDVYFKATNMLGNIGSSELLVDMTIDVSKPEISLHKRNGSLYYDFRNDVYYVSAISDVKDFLLAVTTNEAGSTIHDVIVVGNGDLLLTNIPTYIQLYNNGTLLESENIILTHYSLIILITIIDEVGNVSEPLTFEVGVDTIAPHVNGGSEYPNDPFKNTNSIRNIEEANGIREVIINGTAVLVDLTMFDDIGSGISKVCLTNKDDTEDCLNSSAKYVYPYVNSNNGYQLTSGRWYVFAFDNVMNETRIVYEFKNVSNGVQFSVIKSTSTISGSSVTLSIVLRNVDDEQDIQSIEWLHNGEVYTSCVGSGYNCVANDNGTYTAKVTSIYDVENTFNIEVENIDTSEIADVGDVPVLDTSKIYNNTYFTNNLFIQLPVITSTLSQISVDGYYSIEGTDTMFKLHSTIIDKKDYNAVNRYEVALSELGLLENGTKYSITISLKAANGKQLDKTFSNLIYINTNNYRDADLDLRYEFVDSEDNVSYPTIANTGSYKAILAKVDSIVMDYDIPIQDYKLVTLGATLNTNDYVTIDREGSYQELQLEVKDWFGNVKTIILSRKVNFTIDRTPDVLITNSDKDLQEANKAYIRLIAYIHVDDSNVKTNRVAVRFADSRHTFVIYDNLRNQILLTYPNEYEEIEFDYLAGGFYIDVIDEAGNVTTMASPMTIDSFDNTPFAIYDVEVKQENDGENASLTLKIETYNVNSYGYEGIVDCGSDHTCSTVNKDNIINTKDLTAYVGHYVQVFAYDLHNNEGAVPTEIRLDAIVDLTGYETVAPTISVSDDVVTNGTATVEVISSVKETVRIIVLDFGSYNDYILTHDQFLNSYKSSSSAIKEIKTIKASEWADVEGGYKYTFTLLLLDGDYNVYVMADDNNIYSVVEMVNVKFDTEAPKASYNSITLGKDTTHNETIYVSLSDSHSRNSTIKYILDDMDPRVYDNSSIQLDNGLHTLVICDAIGEGYDAQVLNCSDTYTIKIDSLPPEFILATADGTIVNKSNQTNKNVNGYMISGTQKYLLETSLKVSDMSFKEATFTVSSAPLSYMFKYDLLNGFTSLNNKLSLEVVNNRVKLLTNQGEWYYYPINVQARSSTVEIAGITFDVEYGMDSEVVSLTPRILKSDDSYMFPLRLLLSIALSNTNDLTLQDVVSVDIHASDRNGEYTDVTYSFDLLKPVISTVNRIPSDTTYSSYLSNDNKYLYSVTTEGYGAIEDVADYRLISCSNNGVNAEKNCDTNAGLYLQVTRGDAKTSSTRLINLLKYIIKIDGSQKYDTEKLSIYYNGVDGQHIDGFEDEDYKLDMLTSLTNGTRREIYIKYTDDVGNYSYYYLTLEVSDTIKPVISGGGKAQREVTIPVGGDRIEVDFSSLQASDDYSNINDIACVFKLSYENGTSVEYNCLESQDIMINGRLHASYNAQTMKMAFFYKQKYTLTYKFTDENNNYATKEFIIDVKDNTPIDYAITANKSGVVIDGNTIDLGEYNYNVASTAGIVLSTPATVVLREPQELVYENGVESLVNYTMENNAVLSGSAKLNGTNIEIVGLKNALDGEYYVVFSKIGTYTVTYSITNASGKETKIIYKFSVADKTAPVITLYEDGIETNNDEYIIDVTANNVSTLTQLRDAVLARLTTTYSDNYSSVEYLSTHSGLKCVDTKTVDRVNKYITSYLCEYSVEDESGNKTVKTITIHIRDAIAPVMQGEDRTTYITSTKVNLELPVCGDNYSEGCDRYYKVNGGEEKKYSKSISISGLQEGVNTIEYYAVDKVSNESAHYVFTYVVDLTAPAVNIILATQVLDDYSLCGILGNEDACIIDNDKESYKLSSDGYTILHLDIYEENINNVWLSKFDGSMFSEILLTDISESGLYRLVVLDRASNATSVEFYVYKEVVDPETNTKSINVISTIDDQTENIVITYRDMYIVEYDSSNQNILYHEQAFSSIKETDTVHVIGVNALNEYVRVVKYNGKDLYNTVTSIKANAAGIKDALITIEGKEYLIMALSDTDVIEEGGSDSQGGNQQGNKGGSGGGGSFTWIFYVLGVIGVLGGGFLIMKLRKRVRAA